MLHGAGYPHESDMARDYTPFVPTVDDVVIYATGINWKALDLDPGVIVPNSARIKDRLVFAPEDAKPDIEPVAIVAFGPSLKDTWQELRNYKTIFTCSGAHKFLIERGITPTYHVESDPQLHKPKMLGEPHPDVTYLMASICHPTYFDLLEAHNVKIKLWHLLFIDSDIYKTLPSGEWLMTGGNTVGVRTMKIAYMLKHWNQHIYGLDMSGTHADTHLRPPKDYKEFKYAGKLYLITNNNYMNFLGLFTDLACCMPNLQYKFYGDGLVQAAVANFKRGVLPVRANLVMKA